LRVLRELLSRLTADEREQQPADPVRLELERDRDARALAVGEGLVPLAIAMSRPPTPRTAQVRGGSSSVISSLLAIVRGPARLATTPLEPTPSGTWSSRRADATPSCHSGQCATSVA
jgi:hypothetical protein